MSDEGRRQAWRRWEAERKRKARPRQTTAPGGRVVDLGGALGDWIRQSGVAGRLTEADVLNRWRELAGEELADRATPVRMERGTLTLRVEDSAWRHQLHYMRKDLIGRINGRMGATVVRKIVFTG